MFFQTSLLFDNGLGICWITLAVLSDLFTLVLVLWGVQWAAVTVLHITLICLCKSCIVTYDLSWYCQMSKYVLIQFTDVLLVSNLPGIRWNRSLWYYGLTSVSVMLCIGGKSSGIFGEPEPSAQPQRTMPPGGPTSNIFGAAESAPVQSPSRSHPNKPKVCYAPKCYLASMSQSIVYQYFIAMGQYSAARVCWSNGQFIGSL